MARSTTQEQSMDRAAPPPRLPARLPVVSTAGRQIVTSMVATAFVVVLLTAMHLRHALPCALFVGATGMLPFVGVLPGTTLVAIAALTHGPGSAAIVLALMFAYRGLEARTAIL